MAVHVLDENLKGRPNVRRVDSDSVDRTSSADSSQQLLIKPCDQLSRLRHQILTVRLILSLRGFSRTNHTPREFRFDQ